MRKCWFRCDWTLYSSVIERLTYTSRWNSKFNATILKIIAAPARQTIGSSNFLYYPIRLDPRKWVIAVNLVLCVCYNINFLFGKDFIWVIEFWKYYYKIKALNRSFYWVLHYQQLGEWSYLNIRLFSPFMPYSLWKLQNCTSNCWSCSETQFSTVCTSNILPPVNSRQLSWPHFTKLKGCCRFPHPTRTKLDLRQFPASYLIRRVAYEAGAEGINSAGRRQWTYK